MIYRIWLATMRKVGMVERWTKTGKKRKELIRYRPLWRLHDIRHASALVSRGESLVTIGKLLGHRLPATTAKYASPSNEATARATNVLGSIIMPDAYPEEEPKAKARRPADLTRPTLASRDQKTAGPVH